MTEKFVTKIPHRQSSQRYNLKKVLGRDEFLVDLEVGMQVGEVMEKMEKLISLLLMLLVVFFETSQDQGSWYTELDLWPQKNSPAT